LATTINKKRWVLINAHHFFEFNLVKYNCYFIIPGTGLINHKAGQNCTVYKIPEAIGVCVNTIFGKWDCVIDTYALNKEQLPPPAN
jgi:hypothetical protein